MHDRSNLLQTPVYLHHLILILATLTAVFSDNQRKKILGDIHLILVYDGLHLPGPFYGQQLAGLFPPVNEIAVFQVTFLEVSHVYKRHAARAETENEHVAGKIQSRLQ